LTEILYANIIEFISPPAIACPRLVTHHRSAADGRDIYYSLNLERLEQLYLASGKALHPALTVPSEAHSTRRLSQKKKPVRVRESCPVFPDDPQQIHWSFPDPAEVEEPARYRAFERTAAEMLTRLRYLLLVIGRLEEDKR